MRSPKVQTQRRGGEGGHKHGFLDKKDHPCDFRITSDTFEENAGCPSILQSGSASFTQQLDYTGRSGHKRHGRQF